MKKIQKLVKSVILKHGKTIAMFAFSFVAISANSSSMVIFGELDEPKGINRFKKFAK